MAIVEGQVVVEDKVIELLAITDDSPSVLIEEETIYFISESEQGPMGIQGLQGISEDEMVYSKRIDFITDNILYRGEGAVGSSISDAVWRIRKIEIATDGDVSETWANGSSAFSNVWDNRSLLTYL
jgi:hypothetical protein